MIDDMAIRNMSPNTQKAYVRAVKNFSKHFGKSPDKLTLEDVRAYQLHLVGRGLQAATIIPIDANGRCRLCWILAGQAGGLPLDVSSQTARDRRNVVRVAYSRRSAFVESKAWKNGPL
jgi:hypothetical protein